MGGIYPGGGYFGQYALNGNTPAVNPVVVKYFIRARADVKSITAKRHVQTAEANADTDIEGQS